MTPSERPLTDAEYESLARFRFALRGFLAFSEAAARDHGLTPAQHQLLLTLRGGHGPMSISAVAEQLHLRLHSAGELVARAADNGVVERLPDPTDARRTLVTITARGGERLEALSVLHRTELRRFRTEMNSLLESIDP
ncbi:MAG: MarR family transcriptional regulator [Ilumatobacteraceae bacterium]